MGMQRLNERNKRAIERRTGLTLWRAWATPTHDIYAVVTEDHRHGEFDRRTGVVSWPERPWHFNTCAERFPEPCDA